MRRRIALVVLTTAALLATVLGLPAAAVPPATPAGLTSAIEAYQPYVGQSVCDPVAKPGVRAFMNLVLEQYPTTGSSGIVRDCGTGGQSEHKEGRAFDWTVSAADAADVKVVNELLTWLLATDKYGNKHAMLRRLGLMYVIWNRQVFKAYQADKGWQPYSGTSAHTDHVHFSFGWNGANKVTSYWDGTVAPVEYGPGGAPVIPTVTPVAVPANLPVLASYGSLTLTPSSSGAAVAALQTALKRPATGTWTSDTTSAVQQFQKQQGLTVSTSWTPAAWLRLLPKPANPFGALEHVDPARGPVNVTGWAIDADDDVPLTIHVYVDGAYAGKTVQDVARPDITATYTQYGAAHGFRMPLTLVDGPHEVCAFGINAAGTPGSNAKLGCLTITAHHGPVGAYESLAQTPAGLQATGWALDADTDAPVAVHLLVDDTTTVEIPAAEVPRPELAARFPDYGAGHGFVADLDLPDGLHKVCAFALNAPNTDGATTLLGCKSLTVVHSGVGVLDPVVTPPGTVTVSGAALDPDSPDPVDADIYVDDAFVRRTPADGARPAQSAYLAWGDDHGFTASLTLAEGTRKVCAFALNKPGTPGSNRLLGCQSVLVQHSPLGAQESVVQTAEGLVVKGWALDPDTASPATIRVLVDGAVALETTATAARTDVAQKHPALGANHGYRVVLPDLAAGTRTICTQVLNVTGTPGSTKALPCTTATVRHAPAGVAPTLGRRGNLVTLAGWAVDPNTSAPIDTHVYVDGKFAQKLPAATTRTGLPAPWSGYGTNHGYAGTLDLAAGTRKVCVYGLNVGAGSNALLGCSSILVRHSPFGNISSVTKRTDGVAVYGWAIDPDTLGATSVRIVWDGKTVRTLTANLARADVGRAYPFYGPNHGWSTLLHPTKGRHRLCAIASNVSGTPGAAATLACTYVTV